MTTTFPPEFVAAVYALGNDVDALQAEVESLEGIEVTARRGQDEPTHRPEPDVPDYCRLRNPHEALRGPAMSTTTTTTPYGVIVTETEDYISFRLPSWVTDDERARIKAALDEWYAEVVNAVSSSAAVEEGPR